MFGLMKKMVGAAAKEVQADYSGNEVYLRAVVSGVALVANADGELEDSERQKASRQISNHPVLSKFYKAPQIDAAIQEAFTLVRDAAGRQTLALRLDAVKGNGTMPDDVYLLSEDIAKADGEIEPAEATTLSKIANRLGVDTTKFDF